MIIGIPEQQVSFATVGGAIRGRLSRLEASPTVIILKIRNQPHKALF